MQGQWFQWTDGVWGTVHFYFFMNGGCACPGYPHKALNGWRAGRFTWVN